METNNCSPFKIKNENKFTIYEFCFDNVLNIYFIFNMIQCLFENQIIIFQYISAIDEDIDLRIKYIDDLIYVSKGKTRFKFFQTESPNFLAKINLNELEKILLDWNNVVYQKHILYICDLKDVNKTINAIKDKSFNDFNNFTNMVIKSIPEGLENYSFSLQVKKEYSDIVKKYICNNIDKLL